MTIYTIGAFTKCLSLVNLISKSDGEIQITLNKIHKAIKPKRPENMTHGVILSHDDVPSHAANVTNEYILQKNDTYF